MSGSNINMWWLQTESDANIAKRAHCSWIHIDNYPPNVEQAGVWCMYHKLRKNLLWPKIKNDVHQTVRNCTSCARSCERLNCKRYLQIFRVIVLLERITMDMLVSLPQTKVGDSSIIVPMDCFSKLARVVFTSKKLATHATILFFDKWSTPYEVHEFLLTDNCPEFVSENFATLWEFLPVPHMTTTA